MGLGMTAGTVAVVVIVKILLLLLRGRLAIRREWTGTEYPSVTAEG